MEVREHAEERTSAVDLSKVYGTGVFRHRRVTTLVTGQTPRRLQFHTTSVVKWFLHESCLHVAGVLRPYVTEIILRTHTGPEQSATSILMN